MSLLLPCSTFPSNPIHQFPHSKPALLLFHICKPQFLQLRGFRSSIAFSTKCCHGNQSQCFPTTNKSHEGSSFPRFTPELRRVLAASVIVFLGVGFRTCSAASSAHIPPILAADGQKMSQQHSIEDGDLEKSEAVDTFEDEEIRAAFEKWKSKTYSLTVSLRIIALRSSVPPLWIKNFVQAQGKRAKLCLEFRGSINDIFSELSMAFSKKIATRKSAVAADIVTLGDSWLSFAINKTLIEPLLSIEDQEWFGSLSEKWKVYLRRNNEGKLDSEGKIWAAPYRWGSIVIAYKKRKFQKLNLAPIEDWSDLWRPELAGRISMIDSPREVVGAVLKSMGASYNTKNIDSEVVGGRNAVQQKLALLQKQVRLFDSVHYLKAFEVGDVLVAVGWSSDIVSAAKRMSDIAVIVPKSGASLWADMWAIPAASKFKNDQIGGRVRGPSPLVHQWIEFCLQHDRQLSFKEEVVPGASPSTLEGGPVEHSTGHQKNKPKLDTNLVAGVPPAEILKRCEFLEPLSDAALSDYQWLIAQLPKNSHGLIEKVHHYIIGIFHTFQNFHPNKLS